MAKAVADALVVHRHFPWRKVLVFYSVSMFLCVVLGVVVGLSLDQTWSFNSIQSQEIRARLGLASKSITASTSFSSTWSLSSSATPSSSITPSVTPPVSVSASVTPSHPQMVDFDWAKLSNTETCMNFDIFYKHLRDRMLSRWPNHSITKQQMYNTYRRIHEPYEMSIGTGLIKNGKLYASVGKYYIYRPTSFLNLLGEAFVKYPRLAMMLPPVEFVWDQTDAPLAVSPPAEMAPVWGYTGRTGRESTSIALPDYSYDMSETITNREAPMRTWDDAYIALQRYSSVIPYENRIKKAIFRGAGNRYRFGMADYLMRNYENFNGVTDWLDFDIIWYQDGWKFKLPSVPTSNYSNYAVQLYVDGNGASARFKYLLLSGSPVIKFIPPNEDQMQFEMWYFPFLEPNVHYVPISKYSELEGAVKDLLDNPAKAKKMADDAAEIMLKLLHPDSYPCYFMAAFAALAPKLAYEPEVHKILFPVAYPTSPTTIEKYSFGKIHDMANLNMSRCHFDHPEAYYNHWFD